MLREWRGERMSALEGLSQNFFQFPCVTSVLFADTICPPKRFACVRHRSFSVHFQFCVQLVAESGEALYNKLVFIRALSRVQTFIEYRNEMICKINVSKKRRKFSSLVRSVFPKLHCLVSAHSWAVEFLPY